MRIFKDALTDLRNIDQGPKIMRKFGLVLGGVLVIFCLIIWFKHRHETTWLPLSSIIFLGLSLLSVSLAVVYPKSLKPLNTLMVFCAMIIGWIMTRVILIILFYGVFTPIGLCLKIVGKDNLRRKINPNQSSYWIQRSDSTYDRERSKRLF